MQITFTIQPFNSIARSIFLDRAIGYDLEELGMLSLMKEAMYLI